jgi:hypothetical protein
MLSLSLHAMQGLRCLHGPVWLTGNDTMCLTAGRLHRSFPGRHTCTRSRCAAEPQLHRGAPALGCDSMARQGCAVAHSAHTPSQQPARLYTLKPTDILSMPAAHRAGDTHFADSCLLPTDRHTRRTRSSSMLATLRPSCSWCPRAATARRRRRPRSSTCPSRPCLCPGRRVGPACVQLATRRYESPWQWQLSRTACHLPMPSHTYSISMAHCACMHRVAQFCQDACKHDRREEERCDSCVRHRRPDHAAERQLGRAASGQGRREGRPGRRPAAGRRGAVPAHVRDHLAAQGRAAHAWQPGCQARGAARVLGHRRLFTLRPDLQRGLLDGGNNLRYKPEATGTHQCSVLIIRQ